MVDDVCCGLGLEALDGYTPVSATFIMFSCYVTLYDIYALQTVLIMIDV